MNRKNLLMWATAVLMVFTAANGFAQEEKKGSKIEIKELEDGFREAQFIDETGKIVSKVSLNIIEKTEMVTEKKQVGQLKKINKYKVKKETISSPKTSSNKKFLLLGVSTMPTEVIREDETVEYVTHAEDVQTELRLYDANGKLLWSKQLPEGRGASASMLVSDNGETSAISSWTERTEEVSRVIFVYDKDGNEIMRVPSENDVSAHKDFYVYGTAGASGISSNGKYLAVKIKYGRSPSMTRFYNVKSKTYWDANATYGIFSISDDGLVKAAKSGNDPIEYFELKKYIGD